MCLPRRYAANKSTYTNEIRIPYETEERRTTTRNWPALCSNLASSTQNTTDDGEQQVASVALRLQQLTTRYTGGETTVCSVDNSRCLTLRRTADPTDIYRENISPGRGGASGRGPERGNRISNANFLTAFHTNYGSILLSFRDMTIGRTTEDRRRNDEGSHRKAGQQKGISITSTSAVRKLVLTD